MGRSAVCAMLLASAEAAYVGPAATPRLPSCPRVASTPRMISAQEVFGQYYEASPPMQKSMQTTPPVVAKGAMAGLVAVTGAAGFILTPSRRIAVNAVGGALAANVGNLARKRLADERQKASTTAVASLLAEGLPKVTPEALGAIASEYDVPKKQFETQCAELYLTFLNACLTSHTIETAELSDLLRLQQLLRLSAAQAGTQIYAAARQLYSRHRAYLEDDEMSDSKKLLAKFVFLAERILARDDSPEGYRYEALRLQKLFALTTPEWQEMSEQAAVPFYEKALASAVLAGKPVSAKNLAAVRQSLGIVDHSADELHADVFSMAAEGMLQAGGIFSAADQERLGAVQELLALPPATASRTLRALTAPLYTATFDETLGELAAMGGAPDVAFSSAQAGKLASASQSLLLVADDARQVEVAAMRACASGKLQAAVAALKAQDVPNALGEVRGLVGLCERVCAFMVGSGLTDRSSESALPALFGGLNGELKKSEGLGLYRVLLADALEDLKVDEAECLALEALRVILGLSDQQSALVYQAAAGPLFRKAVTAAVEGDALGDKSELDAKLADLALPADVTKAMCVEVYTEKLNAYAGGATILDEDQSAKLATLRSFLNVDMDDVYSAHAAACSGAYRDSVKQVMGAMGVIPDEYFEGLARLRERLGLSEEIAQEIFAVEVTAKMKEFGEKAVEALEEKRKEAQAQAQKEQDPSADGGSMGMAEAAAGSKLATEVLNLVDFAVASKALVQKEAASKDFEVCGANLRQEFEDATLKDLYKQFLIEAFSGKNPTQNQRLFDNLSRLALVLGLKSDEVSRINNEIGSYIIRNYVSKQLKDSPLGQEGTNFLASIKDALSMDQAKVDELVRSELLNKVSYMIEGMFEKSAVIAEDVRSMRDVADLYDIDLEVDLQVSAFKLERMFMCELEDLVDNEKLQANDMSALIELCEPLHISEDAAQRMLEQMVQKRIEGGVLQAKASLLQQNNDAAIADLKRVLKFGGLLPDVVTEAKAVAPTERQELFMLHQASQVAANVPPDEAAARAELLKQLLGLNAAKATA